MKKDIVLGILSILLIASLATNLYLLKNNETQKNNIVQLQENNKDQTPIARKYTWKIYKGAWFDLAYPSDFTLKYSTKSTIMEGDNVYDSVFFNAPSNEAFFYVYSPEWNGDPKDIWLSPTTEKTVVSKVENVEGDKITYQTIAAKDGSYFREITDKLNEEQNTRLIFAFQYKDIATREKYIQDYERFKDSIIQFGD